MIPLQLQLKNFLSYGASFQTIDFSSYQLICLSGKNGHGKSALLDAMTWALWGQARKSHGLVRADQSLLRLGTTQMVVIFDFSFNGNNYRVKREFYISHRKKTFCVLEFGLFKSDKKTIIPLTDKTIRDTQKKIISTIGLDFDTFVNSAFLRQGNANEFSKKSSRERKDILGKILSLEQYELLRKKATEKVKTAQTQKEVLLQIQKKRLEKKENLTTITNDWEQLKKDIADLLSDEKKITLKESNLQKEKRELEQQEHHIITIKKALDSYNNEKEKYWKEITKYRIQWHNIRKKKRLQNKQTLEKKRSELQQALTEQQNALQKKLTIEQTLLSINSEIENIKQKHALIYTQKVQKEILQKERQSAHIKQLEKQKEELITKQNKYKKELIAITKEKQSLEKTIINQEQKTDILPALTTQFEKRKNAYQQYTTIGNMIRSQLQDITKKQSLCKNDQTATCPLCEQNVSASRRRFLKDKLDIAYTRLQKKFNRLKNIIPSLKKIVVTQHKKLEIIRDTAERIAILQVQLNEYKKKEAVIIVEQKDLIQIITKHESALTLEIKHLETIKNNIYNIEQEKESFKTTKPYIIKQEKLQFLQKKLQKNKYNESHYKKLQEELIAVDKQLQCSISQEEDVAIIAKVKQSIFQLLSQLRTNKIAYQKQKNKLQTFAPITTQKKALEQKNKSLSDAKEELKKRREILLEKKGKLQTTQENLNLLLKEYKQEEETILHLKKTIEDYSIIATAASKEGIQALLIENAIPEIEHEANRLLKKLTTNNTHIIIESLRDLKRGGTKETLDINISDPAGIRPYELFSGGEAFRIDLALRIAISKLLAGRTGTALQTLIIDEGFGSQDEDGLQNIMDAIYKIQDDFCKVIIVSHLPAMKDSFPVHFFVHKSPKGSQINIIEQG